VAAANAIETPITSVIRVGRVGDERETSGKPGCDYVGEQRGDCHAKHDGKVATAAAGRGGR